MSFAIGDTVMLKSGGPLMTVESIGEHGVGTTWFEGEVMKAKHGIPVATLKKIEPELYHHPDHKVYGTDIPLDALTAGPETYQGKIS